MSKDQERIAIMAKHYIIAALFADSDDGTHPRATKSAMDTAIQDCRRFCEIAGPEMLREVHRRHSDGYGMHPDCGREFPVFAAMGHDLWLTRNGHGAGFWDRSELQADDLGDKLSDIARAMRQPDYEFYRGWLYLYPSQSTNSREVNK